MLFICRNFSEGKNNFTANIWDFLQLYFFKSEIKHSVSTLFASITVTGLRKIHKTQNRVLCMQFVLYPI